MESKVIKLPTAASKPPKGPKSDQELVKAIHKAQRGLAKAINEAVAAGLDVHGCMDFADLYGGRVRCIEAKIMRTYK